MRDHNLRRMGILVSLVLAPLPSMAQTQSQRQTQGRPQTQNEQLPGRVAESAVGEVGQRQTREQANIEPMARINSRIANRVQNRIRNRIDRYYNPQANTTSPFEVAAEQAQDSGSRVRR
ncbi:hypothetical protein GCM10011494_07860 [Novosphingobium endophyticum]|uniref:Uncharacterized protein n=1 Tax=Novosphingobium endophyticum TaxID=1955250 RepID=A0A916TQK5_9SPHN|nr:hypothetical protein [Novosphingobium endophyticum]GGB91915.1 hypothetical protein GCM10011494_07860 [Novosphingobium endophyticum]